jgi:hypothetical protein
MLSNGKYKGVIKRQALALRLHDVDIMPLRLRRRMS